MGCWLCDGGCEAQLLPSQGPAFPLGQAAKPEEDKVNPHLDWTVPLPEQRKGGGADHRFTNLSIWRWGIAPRGFFFSHVTIDV